MKPHSKSIFTLAAFLLVAAMAAAPSSQSAQAAGTWYVATTGSDGNDCLTPSTPCGTINGAMGKAASGDTIKVVVGTYTGTGREVVLIDKDINLSGGWDASFASQSGMSTIDGGGARPGVVVYNKAAIDYFAIQKGYSSSSVGGGIVNYGILALTRSTVSNNTGSRGGGIYNSNILTITNSLVANNAVLGSSQGSGIFDSHILALNNSTVSGNTGAPAIHQSPGSTSYINNSTVAENSGGLLNTGGYISLRNTIVADNGAWDCVGDYLGYGGSVTSFGYNIIQNNIGCTVVSSDRTGIDPGISPLQYNGGPTPTHALQLGNPAINAGNPAGCTDHLGNPISVDQRGAPRAGRCDIGAYEANLIATKAVSGEFRPAGTVTYTIELTNFASGIDLTNVALTDTLPIELTYISGSFSSSNGSGDASGGVITWTGDVVSNPPTIIVFGATVSPAAVNQVVTNTINVRWGEFLETASTNFDTRPHLYLPLLSYQYCPSFFDDFSNPSSGWPVGEDDLVRVEYLGGEYRILSKNGDYIYLFRSPACARQNYTVEMDARWVGGTGDSYGLLFGITSGFSQYYLFDMNTDYQMYRLYRYGPSGFTAVAPVAYSSAIRSGTATNHLKVTRSGSQITLAVNGATLGTWYDSTITGLTWVGLMSNPYSDVPISDARFDNFSVNTVQATGAGVTASELSGITTQAAGSSVDSSPRMTVPGHLDWGVLEKQSGQEPR